MYVCTYVCVRCMCMYMLNGKDNRLAAGRVGGCRHLPSHLNATVDVSSVTELFYADVNDPPSERTPTAEVSRLGLLVEP